MSRSELHNWECAIESLCGDNADKVLAIVQDIYNTAFVHGKNCVSSITSQRPKGKWITSYDNDRYEVLECSKCGFEVGARQYYNFCPACGSYNGGKNNNEWSG